MDLTKTVAPKSDQLNADDLIGGSKTITITSVKVIDSEVQPTSIYFEGDDNKPYKPSKGMRRVLIELWGLESDDYLGKKLTLFRDDSVVFSGAEVGGIRISHASGISEAKKVLTTIGRGKRRPITIEPLIVKKKQITDISAAKKAIADGSYTFEKISEIYELSDEQIKELKS